MTRDNEAARVSAEARPWLFLSLTLGLTWALECLAAAVGGSIPAWGVTALRFGGGLMPLAVAVGLTLLKHDGSFQRDYWRRLVDWRRIGVSWYAVILLYSPLKSCVAAVADVLGGGAGIAPEALSGFVQRPLVILPTLAFWLLFGPIPEEPGWRGYALDGLQARTNALYASLIVGVVWSLWHLPLFFIKGTWQAGQVGLGTQRFWLYMLTIVVESSLYTWIYNNTRRSTLSAILFHFVGNAFGELFALSARAEVYSFLLAVAAVLCVVLIWGPRTMTRGEGVP
jgi:membrane protease YdiL (CAAX protease family)